MIRPCFQYSWIALLRAVSTVLCTLLPQSKTCRRNDRKTVGIHRRTHTHASTCARQVHRRSHTTAPLVAALAVTEPPPQHSRTSAALHRCNPAPSARTWHAPASTETPRHSYHFSPKEKRKFYRFLLQRSSLQKILQLRISLLLRQEGAKPSFKLATFAKFILEKRQE